MKIRVKQSHDYIYKVSSGKFDVLFWFYKTVTNIRGNTLSTNIANQHR